MSAASYERFGSDRVDHCGEASETTPPLSPTALADALLLPTRWVSRNSRHKIATPPVGGISNTYISSNTYTHTHTMLHMKGLLFLLLGLAVTGQARVLKQVHHDSDDFGVDFSSPGRGLKSSSIGVYGVGQHCVYQEDCPDPVNQVCSGASVAERTCASCPGCFPGAGPARPQPFGKDASGIPVNCIDGSC